MTESGDGRKYTKAKEINMSIVPFQNNNYSVGKDKPIFIEGLKMQSFNLLLQGKIDVYTSTLDETEGLGEAEILKKSYRLYTLDQNNFWGVSGFFLDKKHSASYVASEDCNSYMWVVNNPEQAQTVLESQKDYGAYLVASISNELYCAFTALNKINQYTKLLDTLTDRLGMFFWSLKDKYGFSLNPSEPFFTESQKGYEYRKESGTPVPGSLEPDYFEKGIAAASFNEWDTFREIDTEKIDYIMHVANLPMEIRRELFSRDPVITSYYCADTARSLADVLYNTKAALKKADEFLSRLYSAEEENIFSELCKAASEMKSIGIEPDTIFETLDYILQKINNINSSFKREFNHQAGTDTDLLGGMVQQLKEMTPSLEALEAAATAASIQMLESDVLPEELKGSVQKIINYSGIPKDRYDLFFSSLQAFKSLDDKLSTNNDAHSVRSGITPVFFEIYEAIFRKVQADKNNSRLMNMFLLYGFMDESLLSKRNIVALYKSTETYDTSSNHPVFSMRDWLGKIYANEKEPSVNEFGQDYSDIFREMKKNKKVTDRDKDRYDNDVAAKVSFEVNNMFKTNLKLTYGTLSTFFPILHEDMVGKDPLKALVTPESVHGSIQKILEIDYSAFHREISYRNPVKGIEKEFIMKAFPADIILMPTFGSRALMWQELQGRNRSTPGRFILPVMTGENLDDLILRLMGNFRWELCRTMMGASWNDISQKSLTSEYTDYIQFYKKNKDLSDEGKEKVKIQIQKYNNRMREIFTSDYETWLNYESKGIMRLNKIARGILYRYCPFPRELREQLEKHPLFSDLANANRISRAKELKNVENRYTKLTRSGIVLDEEMEENLRFYREL